MPEQGTVRVQCKVLDPKAAATARRESIEGIGRKAPVLVEFDYQNGPILLRPSKRLTPVQAGEYEAALKKVR